MYTYVEKMIQLYNLLQDELSKNIFWARLQYEAEPNIDRAANLCRLGQIPSPYIALREQFASAAANRKKAVLYGAGSRGTMIAERLLHSHVDFYAFCDQKKAGETVMGKPVLSPKELMNCPEQYVVVITTRPYYQEILQILQENGFPLTSILNRFGFGGEADLTEMYREFPELFRPGTAIVDAGCSDGEDTILFSKWCAGAYSKIYAFEPSETFYILGKANIEAAKIPNVELFQAGLSKTSGKGSFVNDGNYLKEEITAKSNVPQSGSESTTVQIYALDDLADVEIGMIKMDIEGAEFDALHGAEQTIQRDKPQLAICVYHRQGDMLAIMDYLHSLVPEYRFWLRHYGTLDDDTVLYAAV